MATLHLRRTGWKRRHPRAARSVGETPDDAVSIDRHLDGRRDHALYLGVAAALLRPEAWPFLALYSLWLWFFEPRLRLRLVAFAVLMPACWILPE